MRNLKATEADLLCETADYNLSIDLDRSVARLKGAPLRCTMPAANFVFEAGPVTLTYDGWTDDPYVGRLATEIESLRYGDEWRVGRVRTLSSTTKAETPERKDGKTGGVLDTVNVTYGQAFEWEMENVSSAYLPIETKRFALRTHADKMPARVFDYLMALAVQGDFGGADPLEAVAVLQDAFVRGGFTVDVDESRWETNVGGASFAGRLAAVKTDENAPQDRLGRRGRSSRGRRLSEEDRGRKAFRADRHRRRKGVGERQENLLTKGPNLRFGHAAFRMHKRPADRKGRGPFA